MSRWRFLAAGFLSLTVLDTTAHVFFKLAALGLPPGPMEPGWLAAVAVTPQVYVAVACYIATFFIWMTLLRDAPIGPAFAASHLEVLGVLMASVTLFHERVSLTQWIGACAILAGIACLALGEKTDSSRGAASP